MKLRICRRFEWSWLKYLWLSPLRISVPKFRTRKIVNQVNLCKIPIFHEMLLRPCIKIWKHRAVIGNRMKLGSFSVVKKSIPAWSSMVQRVSPAPSDLQHTCLLLSNLTSTHSHQGREARIRIARNGLLAMRFQRERGDETSWECLLKRTGPGGLVGLQRCTLKKHIWSLLLNFNEPWTVGSFSKDRPEKISAFPWCCMTGWMVVENGHIQLVSLAWVHHRLLTRTG